MRKLYKMVFFVTLSLLGNNVRSQALEHYFSDQQVKEGGAAYSHINYKNKIIIGARSFDKAKYNPSVICFDTAGNVVWKTIISDTSIYYGGNVYVYALKLGLDSFLYAAYGDNSKTNEIWKINPLNGLIIWKKRLANIYAGRFINSLTDFDTTKLIFSYTAGYNGSVYEIRLASISKSSGDILSDHLLGKYPWQNSDYTLGIDDKKDIFFTKTDTLFKVSGSNPDSIIWKKSYPVAKIADLKKIYYDSASSLLFLFGKQNKILSSGTFIKVNPNTGNLISDHVADAYDVSYSDMKVYDKTMYITWRHIYVGGGVKAFWTTKYDMTGDSIIWSTQYHYPGGGGQAAISLDVDSFGDIYLTGYFGSANYGPANWGIVKLKGSNGTLDYYKTITQDSSTNDDESTGIASCVINNEPYFVGNLQNTAEKGGNNTAITFVKLEPLTGKVLIKKDLFGDYQFRSATISIQDYNDGKALVMKQIGGDVKFEMYDSSKKVMWEKTFKKPRSFLLGGNISISPTNGDIYFSAHSVSDNAYDSYFIPTISTDSIHVFHLNNLGNLLKEYGFRVDRYLSAPIELYTDSVNILLFYTIEGKIWCKKIFPPTLYPEYNTLIDRTPLLSKTKNLYELDTNQLLLFYSRRVLRLEKDKMEMSLHSNLPYFKVSAINYVVGIDSNHIILCGKNFYKHESILLYNHKTKDTIWTKELSTNPNSEVLKGVLDENQNYLYSISHSSSNILIRKNKVLDGQLEWTYTFNGVDSLDDCPIDISYDKVKKHLLITGYEGAKRNTKVVILVLDSMGNSLTTVSKDGDFVGDNAGICTYFWNDGTKWVGGHLNKNTEGLAGFIYGLGNCVTPKTQLTYQTCQSYLSPSGKYTWATSGTYYDTLTNSSGCDSLIEIHLTINSSSYASISQVSCNTYLSPSGKYMWAASGIYVDTLSNLLGCDSIITINLLIGSYSTSSVSITACDNYRSPSGKYLWTTSGIYGDTILSVSGCDSIITINLTIHQVNTGVTNTNNILTASLVGGIYQWIDCNGFTPILNDTLQSFTPTKNGDYAVIVTDGNCTDTSACYTVTNTGINNSFIKESISVSPNPSKGIYNVSINSGFKKARISIYNAIGQLVIENNGITANTFSIDMTEYESGIYYIEVINGGVNTGMLKLIKY